MNGPEKEKPDDGLMELLVMIPLRSRNPDYLWAEAVTGKDEAMLAKLARLLDQDGQGGDLSQALAVAKADLQGDRRDPSEDRCGIDQATAGRDPVKRPKALQRVPLTRRQATLAAHEAAHPPALRRGMLRHGTGHRFR